MIVGIGGPSGAALAVAVAVAVGSAEGERAPVARAVGCGGTGAGGPELHAVNSIAAPKNQPDGRPWDQARCVMSGESTCDRSVGDDKRTAECEESLVVGDVMDRRWLRRGALVLLRAFIGMAAAGAAGCGQGPGSGAGGGAGGAGGQAGGTGGTSTGGTTTTTTTTSSGTTTTTMPCDPVSCPAPLQECKVAVCGPTGICGVENTPYGAPAKMQTDGDCKLNICKNGVSVSADDDTDIDDDHQTCTIDGCSAGMVLHDPNIQGTACAEGGGSVCDADGHCVECNTTADCIAPAVCNAAGACVTPPG